jgi:putative NADH-flavin reductase
MSKQKIALFGATGKAGGNIMAEALDRKHKVTAITYDINKVPVNHHNLNVVYGHMINKEEIENHVKGHDVVIAVHEPLPVHPIEHVKSIRAVIDGSRKAGVRKLVVIGHPIHRPIENTMEFYDLWKPIILAQREALKLFQQEGLLNWTYLYSANLEPDTRTGRIDRQDKMCLANNREIREVPLKNYVSIVLDEANAKKQASNFVLRDNNLVLEGQLR